MEDGKGGISLNPLFEQLTMSAIVPGQYSQLHLSGQSVLVIASQVSPRNLPPLIDIVHSEIRMFGLFATWFHGHYPSPMCQQVGLAFHGGLEELKELTSARMPDYACQWPLEHCSGRQGDST